MGVENSNTGSGTFSPDAIQAHNSGDLHIHHPSTAQGYGIGVKVETILGANPARTLNDVLQNIAEFLKDIDKEWSGIVSLNHIDTHLAPYLKKEGISEEEVGRGIRNLIHGLDGLTTLTNLSLDLKTLEADYQPEIDVINTALCRVFASDEHVFRNPVLTYNIAPGSGWDAPTPVPVFKLAARYGTPCFQNLINSKLDADKVRAPFSQPDGSGSIGAVTLNMPRLAYLAEDEGEFLERLGELMEQAKNLLEDKRARLEEQLEEGRLPATGRLIDDFQSFSSSISLVGMNETLLNLIEADIASLPGKAVTYKTLEYMRNRAQEFSEETGHRYAIEALPDLEAGHRLAALDRERFPEIITAGDEVPYYTGGTQLPSGYTDDLWDALEHQKRLQALYDGGSVFHLYLDKPIRDPEACRLLVRRIFESFTIPSLTISPKLDVKGEIYARFGGVYTPVGGMSKAQKEDYRLREAYAVSQG